MKIMPTSAERHRDESPQIASLLRNFLETRWSLRARLSRLRSHVSGAWSGLTSGMEISDLWTQFKQETSETSRVYQQEMIQHVVVRDRTWKRPFKVFGKLSWNVLAKLSPARRVFFLLTVIVATVAISGFPLLLPRGLEFALAVAGMIVLLALVLGDHLSMKRDIEIAHEIQRWLLPRGAPEVPGIDIAFTTRPARTIGGDYYDAFRRSGDGPLLIAVADVAGKSVPAAMVMATFQASLRALAISRNSLTELMTSLNRQMYSNSRTGRFTTAFIAELDPTTGRLHYLCAGHNPPILRRANGGIERLNSDNIPLGIELAEIYQVGVSHLTRDDVLVIYTDGVTEARNPEQEAFGEERLVAALEDSHGQRAAPTLAAILGNLSEFVGLAPQHDDITCMVVRRN